MGKSLKKAVLVLESGKTYEGCSFGAECERFGEVVFNTSMTGYQEILTDPSYKGQIIAMTEPHIGNVGTNEEDTESSQVYCEGFIVRESSLRPSNWRSKESLQEFLIQRNIPAISGIDTRSLTKHLRERGAMRGVLSTTDMNPESLLNKVRSYPQMTGSDFVKEVTCSKPYTWADREWKWGRDPAAVIQTFPAPKFNIVVMDFGIKQNILRCLKERNCDVTVVPAQTPREDILRLKPDGIMLSNGPGDPAAVIYGIKTIQGLIDHNRKIEVPIPIFGICLGHQLLGLALGGKTFKLKFGHRGANHPVKDIATGKIEITTQNHGFCVDIESLANKDVELTHINLNDKTLEGMKHKSLPIFSVQYHPESSAGPHDSRYLFDRFLYYIDHAKKN